MKLTRLLFLATLLLAGCSSDLEDQQFFERGWVRPRSSPDDRAYFYGSKTKRGLGPESPKLPSEEYRE